MKQFKSIVDACVIVACSFHRRVDALDSVLMRFLYLLKCFCFVYNNNYYYYSLAFLFYFFILFWKDYAFFKASCVTVVGIVPDSSSNYRDVTTARNIRCSLFTDGCDWLMGSFTDGCDWLMGLLTDGCDWLMGSFTDRCDWLMGLFTD